MARARVSSGRRSVTGKAKAKPVAKAKAKPAMKASAKPSAKAAVKEKAKPAVKAKAKPVAKPSAKPATKAKTKPAAKTSAKPAAKAKAKPAAITNAPSPAPPAPAPASASASAADAAPVTGDALATLRVRTGRIGVGDPVAAVGLLLDPPVPAGDYPVALELGRDGRPRAVVVRLGDAAPIEWLTATRLVLEAGVLAVADADVFTAIRDEDTGFPTASFRALERQLLDEHYTGGWGWAAYQPGRDGNCVAVIVDGAAVDVAWGVDVDGRPVALQLTARR